MTPSPSSNSRQRQLTPKYVYGGIWVESGAHSVECALCTVVFTNELLIVLDHCVVLYPDFFTPGLPKQWFQYLTFAGIPPTLDILRDQTTPVTERIYQMTQLQHTPTYPLTAMYCPATLTGLLDGEEFTFVSIKKAAAIATFRRNRTYVPHQELRCAPLQFRQHATQYQEVYGTPVLQAAIGCVLAAQEGTQQGENTLSESIISG